MSGKIVIGSDKSGYTLKEAVKSYLQAEGVEFIELGTVDPEVGVPFFKVAPEAAKLLQAGQADRAILICGTGMGMSQVANKFQGVRAACVESAYAARMCRAINDSNALCMGGWVIAPEMGVEMVKVFLHTEHLEGLEPWRQDFLKNAKAEFEKLENEIFGA
ncbi:MAG: RpiB/LacA/LacB family sugar-phosphate isomerase [Bacillota bacterium]